MIVNSSLNYGIQEDWTQIPKTAEDEEEFKPVALCAENKQGKCNERYKKSKR